MRIHSLALATTVSLLASSTFFSGAQAQKGITLQPQTAWAVKKVNKDTPNAYCALARRFKQNLIMTIAQNSKNETSVAFDFSNSNFDTSRIYDITLDPGAGHQREYKFKPASSNAFVVRVGRDGGFLKSLNQTGYLRVDLDGKTYNFNLADIDSGTAQLDACIASSILPAAGDESPLAPFPSAPVSSGPQIAKLEAEKQRLEQKLGDLERENKSLQLKSADVSNVKKQIEMAPTISSESAMVLQKQVDDLKTENSALLKKLDSVGSTQASGEDVSVIELARENQRLQQALETLKTDLSASVDEDEVRRLSAQISRLENENLELSRQTKAFSKDTDIKFLKQNILALKSENDALRLSLESDEAAQDQYSELQSELESIKAENNKLDEKIFALAKEKSDFADQLSFYESENKSLKSKVSSKGYDSKLLENLRTEIKNIERKSANEIARKEVEISSLENEINGLREQNTDIEKAENKIKTLALDFDAQISALRIKNEALKDELISLSKENADIAVLRDRADTLILEKEKLGNSLKGAEQKISILEGELEGYKTYREKAVKLSADIKSVDKQVLDLESANFELREKIQKLQQENALSEKTVLSEKQEILNLQTKIDVLSSLNTKMEDKIAELESSNEKYQASIDTMQNENMKLSEGLQRSALDQDALATLQKENQQLSEELEQSALDQDALTALQNENLQLSEKLKQSALDQDILAALQNENEKLLKSMSSLKVAKTQDVSSLEAKLKELEADKTALTQQLEQQKVSIVENVDSANEQNALLQEEIATLSEAQDAFEQENKDLKLAIANSDDFNKTLQSDWSESLLTIESLRVENARYEEIVADKDEKLEAQSLKISELQDKNADLTAQLEEQTQQYLALVKDVGDQKNAGNFVNASVHDMTESARAFESLKAKNAVLEDEVLNLQRLLKEQKHPSVIEASVKTPVVKAPVVQAKKKSNVVQKVAVKDEVVKDAPYTSQEEQALKNVAAMRSAAKDVDDQEMAMAEKLAAMEPAAGSEMEPEPEQDVERAVGSALDGRPYEVVKQERLEEERLEKEKLEQQKPVDDGLSEAQRLEQRMRGQISEGPVTQASAAVESVEQVKLDEPVRNSAERTVTAVKDVPVTVSKDIYHANVDIQKILGASGIGLKSDVKTVAKHSDDTQISYQWMSNNDLYGSAQQMPMNNPNDFDNNVRDYLTMTEQRCTGDFAIVPSMTSGQGQARVDSYEIACVGAGVDSSASVVFFSKNGTFTILAHEAPTAGMDTAMEARDKIVSTISKS